MPTASIAPPPYRTDRFIAHDLAEWVAALRYEDLSPGSVALAKRFWFDSLGCAAAGSATHDARILLDHTRAMAGGASGPCGVFCSDFSTNPVDAAFLNSHRVRALDFNDVYWKADPAHPSDLICGPLALCEALGRSGRDLILATVVVYELQCRFAEIGRPGIREYGWHHATLSGFAAGLAAGKVLGLSVDELVNATGIAASRTGSLGAVTAGDLTMMKNTVDPWAARMGVESALLAQRGYTGPAHIIDGKEGLFHVMGHSHVAGEPCTFDREGLTHDLPTSPGAHYRIADCSFKSFPVEALMHAPLSALMSIKAEHAFANDEIDEVRVEVIARAADILGDPKKYRPKTRESADHSLPYCFAVGLADGAIGPAQFDDSRVRDASLIPLMDKVRVLPNEAFEARFPAAQPSRVTVVLHDGREHTAEVEYPTGDPRNPMSDAALSAKFRALAEPVLGAERCGRVSSLVAGLDGLADVGELVSAMTLPA
jgi:2-methylcitrate dehydratase